MPKSGSAPHVFVPQGVKPVVPNLILPARDFKELNCVCGCRSFVVHMRPMEDIGTSQVAEIVCANDRCRKVLKLDDRGRVERGGKMTVKKTPPLQKFVNRTEKRS